MALSKSNRMLILLGIDTVFFFVELIFGYAVHSLALVADSFHMLNDVFSLLVGLWAVRVANQKGESKMYTYGWQRAETLGALINGVFLVALCLSIFLEAIQRFVEPQEVSQPKVILIVGSFGLASNIAGLFLFHDHGHSHGGHSHSHGDEASAAEEGHSHGMDEHDHAVADERGNIADVLPQARIGNWPTTAPKTQNGTDAKAKDISWSSANKSPRKSAAGKRITKKHHRSRSRGYSTIDEVYVHPSSFRNSIIEASRMEAGQSDSEADDDSTGADEQASEQSPLLQKSKSPDKAPAKKDAHTEHNHKKPKDAAQGGHGHSHGDLNMRGVFLHVMGDALGNIGVIATALFIWLTDFSWRFYTDPAISLIITVIILCSAIPLCKAASRILLQAVPVGLSIDEIKQDILDLDGILSCHHLHVWQLSDTKLVASLHVQVDFDFKGEGAARYMQLAREIRLCLHEYGIHSSTIQPEFCLDEDHDHSGQNSADEGRGSGSGASEHRSASPKTGSKTGSLRGERLREGESCLLECGEDCGDGKQCCEPGAKGCAGVSR